MDSSQGVGECVFTSRYYTASAVGVEHEVCGTCGALIDQNSTGLHAEWHKEIFTILSGLTGIAEKLYEVSAGR